MRITTMELQAHGACRDGIDAFDRAFPGGLAVAGWTHECQIGAMMHDELRRYLGWAWSAGMLPQWSMGRWDLTRADLRLADLSNADLSGADLRGASLSNASLSNAWLTGAGWDGRPAPRGWICVSGRLRSAA